MTTGDDVSGEAARGKLCPSSCGTEEEDDMGKPSLRRGTNVGIERFELCENMSDIL